MHERMAQRRSAVLTSRRKSMATTLETLAAELERLGNRLDVELFRTAAAAYRDARLALAAGDPGEKLLLELFRALNTSTMEISTLVANLGSAMDRHMTATRSAEAAAEQKPERTDP